MDLTAAQNTAEGLRKRLAAMDIMTPQELGLDATKLLALGDTPWNAFAEAKDVVRGFYQREYRREPTYLETLIPFLQVFGPIFEGGWDGVAGQANAYIRQTCFDPERPIREPEPFGVRKVARAEGTDVLGPAIDEVSLAYRRSHGRTAAVGELETIFRAVFEPAFFARLAGAEDGKKEGDRTGVGFFIPLPEELAEAFPSLAPEDTSPAHITFLYVGEVPKEKEADFLAAAREALAEIEGPVRSHYGELEYFVHPAMGRQVAVVLHRFSRDLAGLRWKLRDKLLDAGLQVDDSFPLIYRPHTTLAYLEGTDSEYDGPIPKGAFPFEGIEVWGLPKLHTIPFGGVAARKVAVRHIDAMTNAASVALMKFLSGVAARLGVGQHVYVVGGAVRNFVLGEPVKDVDIVIDSVALGGKDSAWFAKELTKAIPTQTSLVTNNYGVAILTIKGDWEVGGVNLKGEDIEIANARKESYGGEAGKGYKPDAVEPATIAEDICRREFNFNCLMWRLLDLAEGPDKAEIIDLTGCGLRDLQEGVARCPRDPDIVFADDPSRMVRLVRFVVRYGFKIPPDVEAAVRRNAHRLKDMPSSALSNLLVKTWEGR